LANCLFDHTKPFRDGGVNPHKWDEKTDQNDQQEENEVDEGKPNQLITAESNL